MEPYSWSVSAPNIHGALFMERFCPKYSCSSIHGAFLPQIFMEPYSWSVSAPNIHVAPLFMERFCPKYSCSPPIHGGFLPQIFM
jgi:hypothetical protein